MPIVLKLTGSKDCRVGSISSRAWNREQIWLQYCNKAESSRRQHHARKCSTLHQNRTAVLAVTCTSEPEVSSKTLNDENTALQAAAWSEQSRVAEPIQPALEQDSGGNAGSGSGGGSGGRGGDDGNPNSDSEPERPFFLRILSTLVKPPVLALLISIIMYSWLRARRRRKQNTDAYATSAEQQPGLDAEAALLYGSDWLPSEDSEQLHASASHSSAPGCKTNKRGPITSMAALLPGYRKGQSTSKLRQAT